ncbi:MAG: GDSL-type esterase/lipase family protein [Planctomycetota bacterium]|nr:GDSL-type esterase/lipase family protein [Planctomycetota bacterium]
MAPSFQLPWRRKLLFSIIPSLFLAGAIEGGARLVEHHQSPSRWDEVKELTIYLDKGLATDVFGPHPSRFWSFKKNIELPEKQHHLWWGFVSNKNGYRNKTLPQKDFKGLKVLALGDSTTFGAGVAHDKAWPYVLDSLLDKETPSQVRNLGVPGYTSHQGLDLLREQLEQSTTPDIVVINFGNNDGWYWGNRSDRDYEEARDLQSWLDYSALYRVMAPKETEAQKSPDSNWSAKVFGEGAGERKNWVPRVPVDHYLENYEAMIDLCRKRKITVILVVWPWQERILGDYDPRSDYHDAARSLESRDGVFVIDPELYFWASSFGSALYIDKVHASDLGHVLFAHLLFAKIRELRKS